MTDVPTLRDVNMQLRARTGKGRPSPPERRPPADDRVVSTRESPSYEFILNGVVIGSFRAEKELTYDTGKREAVTAAPCDSPADKILIRLMEAFYGIAVVVNSAPAGRSAPSHKIP